MQTPHKTFFIQQGYTLEPASPARYSADGTHVNPDSNYITPLTQTGLIQVGGEDRLAFLQNLTSNDVQQINTQTTQLSSLCSPKGRLLAIFRLFEHQNRYCLSMPVSLIEATLKRFKMYVLRSKVTLEAAGDRIISIGLGGNNSPHLIQKFAGHCPEQPDASIHAHDLTLIRLPGLHPRFELHGSPEHIIACWNYLKSHAQLSNENDWLLENIRAGLPIIYPETIETFVAQMANLDRVNGISFKKGCYPGQEIIARTHYRGKTKRRMYHIEFNSETCPLPGTPLHDAENTAGELIDAQPTGNNRYEALAVIQMDHLQNPLQLGSNQGPQIRILQLPYTIEAEEETPVKN